jgi:hypothetical protein
MLYLWGNKCKRGGSREIGGGGGGGGVCLRGVCGYNMKGVIIKELVVSWVNNKVMGSKEIMANDGSGNGGKKEREMKLAVTKPYR